jgi:putative molybdopterin biosynthesis protein
MPPEYDAVIMIEHLHRVDDGAAVEAMAPVAPWQHVRPMGEDIVATEMVLPESHRLGPVDLGACAASGATELVVRQQPRVAIIPTGKELVPIGSAGLKPGDIVEFNSLMLAGLIHDWGGRSKTLPPVTDDPALIQDAVLWALEDHDLIIVNAGSSAGSEDFTAQVVE